MRYLREKGVKERKERETRGEKHRVNFLDIFNDTFRCIVTTSFFVRRRVIVDFSSACDLFGKRGRRVGEGNESREYTCSLSESHASRGRCRENYNAEETRREWILIDFATGCNFSGYVSRYFRPFASRAHRGHRWHETAMHVPIHI